MMFKVNLLVEPDSVCAWKKGCADSKGRVQLFDSSLVGNTKLNWSHHIPTAFWANASQCGEKNQPLMS